MRVFYLHGFASSARSSKASFFAARLAELGVALETPDLNEPDFSTLTVSRMVAQVSAALDAGEEPVALVGSSLGAFVAVQVALAQPTRVQKLVLLAPALDFGGNRMRSLGGRGLDDWKATDRLDVFHHGYGRVVPVHYELYADARRYNPSNATLALPVLVFQGRHDTAVDPESVERWGRARPNVELHMLDDDHQLLKSLDAIWERTRTFLGV
ncbi:MAG: YqiA/YcfP family alpha/beta fold hydrolase [Acidobacteriota bacterium]